LATGPQAEVNHFPFSMNNHFQYYPSHFQIAKETTAPRVSFFCDSSFDQSTGFPDAVGTSAVIVNTA